MSYRDVEVNVSGAVMMTATFEDDEPQAHFDAFIEAQRQQAAKDGVPTEIYVLHHQHDHVICPSCGSGQHTETPGGYRCRSCGYSGAEHQFTECECHQYVTDGHPLYAWNVES